MKAHIKSRTGRLLVEVEATNVKELFEQIAEVAEIIDCDTACGCCGSSEIRPRVREIETFKYFEMHCEACNARLSFGQLRAGGGLFPKRRGEHGPLPNRGWAVFLPEPKGGK